MHFEVPKAKSLREFGGEYLMIVISILTALALEHGAQSYHHHQAAREASEKIDAELRSDIKEIEEVLAHNNEQVANLMKTQQELLAGIRDKVGDAKLIEQAITGRKDSLSLSIMSPTLRREAWDVAVANQSVGWMRQDELERYSAAYGKMRDVEAISNSSNNKFLDLPGMRNVASDLQMGVADPRAVFRMLNQMISAYSAVDGNLDGLQKELVRVVGTDGKASSHR